MSLSNWKRCASAAAFVCILAANVGLGHAANITLKCPASISSVQSTPPKVGWEAYELKPDGQHLLRAAAFTDGPPKELATLRPTITLPSKTTSKNTYLVDSSGDTGTWLQCSYADTRLVLTQKLPTGLTACEVTYVREPTTIPEPVVRSIVCK